MNGKIGNYNEGTGEIERDWYRQGFIFKDPDAFYNHPHKVCYVPELSDSAYTANDFLFIANGDKELATDLFEEADWQHPETILDDWISNNELVWCHKCHKYYYNNDEYADIGNVSPCPYCGASNL